MDYTVNIDVDEVMNEVDDLDLIKELERRSFCLRNKPTKVHNAVNIMLQGDAWERLLNNHVLMENSTDSLYRIYFENGKMKLTTKQ
jgi:hypothetical protein